MNSVGSLTWYAVQTKPRQEERAAENLIAWNIEVFAPRLAAKEQYAAWKPFFPGYIFARFDVESKLQKVHFTRGVSQVVSFGGAPAAIDDEVIASIREKADARGVIYPSPAKTLNRGDLVVIHSGLLKDFIGILEEEVPATERIRVLLTTLAYRARAEISRYDVSKVNPQGQA